MELKDTKNLSTSVKIGATPVAGQNDTTDQRIYDIIFPPKEDEADQNIQSINTHKGYEKVTFGAVSTLDWLKTWRSLEEN